MLYQKTILALVSIIVIVATNIFIPCATSCKDIIITPDASAGPYSLFLKVRDPSRPGLQVLCRIPKGTTYTYHYPWSGKPWEFTINHTFFGIATQGDTPPNIIKAGMVLTDAGIAYGDADTGSHWINPSKNSWDDFDWMRYAYQTANNEDEARELLTTNAVDRLHATGVSENLFIVGPQKSVLIEADAVHHTTAEVSDILVMSNYPVDLWKTQFLKCLPIASLFNTTKEIWARKGTTIHLQSICGIKIIDTDQSSVTVKAAPSFAFRAFDQETPVKVILGQQETVGPYRVTLLDINGRNVLLSVSTNVYAWEKEVLSTLQPKKGTITLRDMMDISRLHSEDLNGLRPLCEEYYTYEATAIFRIPNEHSNLLSSGWFAANHACSSIYIPFHICDNDIYDPYQTGEAAALCLDLLHHYGHGTLTTLCRNVENVFIAENEQNEQQAHEMIHNATDITFYLTALDRGMQEQAFLTQRLWMNASNTNRHLIENIWMENYTVSLQRMQNTITVLKKMHGSEETTQIIQAIIKSICSSKAQTTQVHQKSFLPYLREGRFIIKNV